MKKCLTIIPNGWVHITNKKHSVVPTSQFSSEFYKELSDNYSDVKILASKARNEVNGWNISSDKVINIGEVPEKKLWKVFYYIKLFMKSFFVKYNDFVYIFFPGNLAMSILPAMLLRKEKYALYLRGEVRYKNIFLNYLAQKILRKAQFIIATGTNTANFANEFNKNVEEVVPMMSVSSKDLFKREVFEFSSEAKILFFSRVEKEKGVFETIDALKTLLKNGENLKLNIAGNEIGNIFNKIRENIKGFEKNIKISGEIKGRDMLADLFKSSDIYVFPSYHEGFPRVVYEAMTFSIPMIVSDIPAFDMFLENNITCIKTPVKDSEMLAENIKKLIDDIELRKKLSENSYKKMTEYYKKNEGNSHAKQLIRNINNISK